MTWRNCIVAVATALVARSAFALTLPLSIVPGPALNPGTNLITNGSFEAGFSGSPLTGSYWASGTAQTPLQAITGSTTSGSASNYVYRADTAVASSSAPVPDGAVALYFGNGFAKSISETPTFNADGSLTFVSPTPTITESPSLSPPVTLSQTVGGLNIGNIYALSFWTSGEDAAGAGYGHDGIFGLDVTGFGTTFLAAPSGAAGGVGAQKVYRFQFQPVSSTTTFTFTNWGHLCGAPSVPGAETVGWTIPLNTTELVLDHVILNNLGPGEDVPEPSVGALVGAFAAIAVTARRRQQLAVLKRPTCRTRQDL
jgi:hypothetical protein